VSAGGLGREREREGKGMGNREEWVLGARRTKKGRQGGMD